MTKPSCKKNTLPFQPSPNQPTSPRCWSTMGAQTYFGEPMDFQKSQPRNFSSVVFLFLLFWGPFSLSLGCWKQFVSIFFGGKDLCLLDGWVWYFFAICRRVFLRFFWGGIAEVGPLQSQGFGEGEISLPNRGTLKQLWGQKVEHLSWLFLEIRKQHQKTYSMECLKKILVQGWSIISCKRIYFWPALSYEWRNCIILIVPAYGGSSPNTRAIASLNYICHIQKLDILGMATSVGNIDDNFIVRKDLWESKESNI